MYKTIQTKLKIDFICECCDNRNVGELDYFIVFNIKSRYCLNMVWETKQIMKRINNSNTKLLMNQTWYN